LMFQNILTVKTKIHTDQTKLINCIHVQVESWHFR
jgi:hypothetical protein